MSPSYSWDCQALLVTSDQLSSFQEVYFLFLWHCLEVMWLWCSPYSASRLRSRYRYFSSLGEITCIRALFTEICSSQCNFPEMCRKYQVVDFFFFIPLLLMLRMTYLGNRYPNNFASECDRRSFRDPEMLESLVKDGRYVFACRDFLMLNFIIWFIHRGTFKAKFYFIHQPLLKTWNPVFLQSERHSIWTRWVMLCGIFSHLHFWINDKWVKIKKPIKLRLLKKSEFILQTWILTAFGVCEI